MPYNTITEDPEYVRIISAIAGRKLKPDATYLNLALELGYKTPTNLQKKTGKLLRDKFIKLEEISKDARGRPRKKVVIDWLGWISCFEVEHLHDNLNVEEKNELENIIKARFDSFLKLSAEVSDRGFPKLETTIHDFLESVLITLGMYDPPKDNEPLYSLSVKCRHTFFRRHLPSAFRSSFPRGVYFNSAFQKKVG